MYLLTEGNNCPGVDVIVKTIIVYLWSLVAE